MAAIQGFYGCQKLHVSQKYFYAKLGEQLVDNSFSSNINFSGVIFPAIISLLSITELFNLVIEPLIRFFQGSIEKVL